jgi:hypothetical protein
MTHLLRLAVGSHQAGSGKGCAMGTPDGRRSRRCAMGEVRHAGLPNSRLARSPCPWRVLQVHRPRLRRARHNRQPHTPRHPKKAGLCVNRNDKLAPRLSVGAGPADGSKMCAMQVISWENGDATITDMPDCADPVLARIVQNVNDNICTHRDGDLLCPDCSIQVLALAHRTVGTGAPAGLDRRIVWVRLAADQARQVLHLAGNRPAALAAIEAAEAWASKPDSAAAAAAAYAATADAADAAYAATAAAVAAVAAAAAAAAYAAAACAAYAAAANARPGSSGGRLRLAHRAIDLFEQLTGHVGQQPDPDRTAAAYAAVTGGDTLTEWLHVQDSR